MTPLTAANIEELVVEAIELDDEVAIAQLGAVLGKIPEPVQRVATLAEAALWYAEQGLHVFPLWPRAKLPHPGTHGCLDGTSDLDVVAAWWRRNPHSNIGIATGHLVDVIDIDGPVGVKSWSELLGKGLLPELLGHVLTPRAGGHHLYVRADGKGNKAGVYPGVDHRGLGGYVVAPPSVNEYGVRYTWRLPLALPHE